MPRPADTYTHDQSEDLLTNAVQHSFLAYVGSGSLSENDFNQWLAQIGYISRSLVPFTIALIGKIRIPETENLEHNSTFRCLDLLCSAITNMKKELGFLEATKREYGLEVGLDELRLATKSFIGLFNSASCWSEEVESDAPDMRVSMVNHTKAQKQTMPLGSTIFERVAVELRNSYASVDFAIESVEREDSSLSLGVAYASDHF
ncbi:unnamed protein product [Fusarium graminearum]|nr:unnamed protein product [Fusarium graminearum]